jgi:hypothetical protein
MKQAVYGSFYIEAIAFMRKRPALWDGVREKDPIAE